MQVSMTSEVLRRADLSVAGPDKRAIEVLLVEDNPPDARLVTLALSEEAERQFRVSQVDTLAAAVQRLRPGLGAIVLDLGLPDSTGLNGLKELALAAPRTPIIVLTGQDDDELAVEACRHGAQDYIVKGPHGMVVLARAIRCAMERKAFESVLADRAHTDALTGLVNRSLFVDRLTRSLMQARRSGRQAALMFIDLDDFKWVNDTLGHQAGDQVLRAVANALRSTVRQSDTVARIGGDEFTVLLDPIDDAADAAMVASKVMDSLQRAGAVLRTRRVTVSGGIAVFPRHAHDVESMLASADRAMYAAKYAGGNAFRFAPELRKG